MSEPISRHDTTSIQPPDYTVSPDEITGTREEIAARLVVSRHMIGSIPCRSFLTGKNDTSPILAGVRDLAGVCFALLDELAGHEDYGSRVEGLFPSMTTLRAMLETKP